MKNVIAKADGMECENLAWLWTSGGMNTSPRAAEGIGGLQAMRDVYLLCSLEIISLYIYGQITHYLSSRLLPRYPCNHIELVVKNLLLCRLYCMYVHCITFLTQYT